MHQYQCDGCRSNGTEAAGNVITITGSEESTRPKCQQWPRALQLTEMPLLIILMIERRTMFKDRFL